MQTRELDSAPALAPLYAKAALGPGDPGRRRRRGARPRAGARPGSRSIAARLADYARVCGFTVRESLPPTYPHVLGFPLEMALMTER